MFFEQLANSGSYNRIIAVNRVGRPSHRMWRRQHQNQRLLRLKSAIFLLKRRLLCCSEQLDWDREGNEWDGYVAKGCTRALKTTRATDRSVYRNWWKNRQDPHILCVQLSFLWSAMLSWALASVVSPNSPGAGLFTVLKVLYQSKNLILPAASAAAVFILWDFRCYQFGQLICL